MRNDLAFYLSAGLTAIFAIAAMTVRHLIYCALFAAAAFAGLAVVYLRLNAEFAGFAQVLVYVGAIAILIVFAILLTRGDEIGLGSPGWKSGVAIALLVMGSLATVVLMSPSLQRIAIPGATAPVRKIGEELMTRYVLPLEMVGLLLTAALLGAVVVAMRDEPEIRRPADVDKKAERMSLR